MRNANGNIIKVFGDNLKNTNVNDFIKKIVVHKYDFFTHLAFAQIRY